MPNFFTDNADLMFRFENLGIEEQVAILEDDYTQAAEFDYAPESYEDAIDNYRRVTRAGADSALAARHCLPHDTCTPGDGQ